MSAPITCSNCHAMLNKQWFDHSLGAYQCRVCNHLTGPEGQPLGLAPKRGFRSSGLAFIAVALFFLLGVFAVFVLPDLIRN